MLKESQVDEGLTVPVDEPAPAQQETPAWHA
jgi:hypothetical protein